MHRLGQWDQGWKLRSNARKILTSFPSSSEIHTPSFFYILYKFPSKDRVCSEVAPPKPSQLLRWQSLKTPGSISMNIREEGFSPFHNLHPNFCWSLLSPRGTYNIPRLAIYLYSLGLGVAEIEKYAEVTFFQRFLKKFILGVEIRGGQWNESFHTGFPSPYKIFFYPFPWKMSK